MKMKRINKLFSFILAMFLVFNFVISEIAVRADETVNSFTITSGMKDTMDDSEEWLSGSHTGNIDYNSTDLEICWEKPADAEKNSQIIAVRFAGLTIPEGATITNAYIQFTADGDNDVIDKCTNPFDVNIYAEDTANSAPINKDVQYNISSRTKTATYVNWHMDSEESKWTTKLESGEKQRTPDLSTLVQEIIDNSGWASGNALCFLLTGIGNRTTATSEDSAGAGYDVGPVLHVSFDYAGKIDQPAPTGLAGVAPTSPSDDDGQITGTTAEMEYKLSEAEEDAWADCDDEAMAGLSAGTYVVRYKETAEYNAGLLTTIIIPAYATAVYNAEDITLQPGADATQMNFNWYSGPTTTASSIQIALKDDMTGSDFPVDSATTFNGTVATASTSYKSNAVTVTGLEPSTEYVYRVGSDTDFSPVYSFKTQNDTSYNALLMGDPQIGSSGNEVSDTAGWQNTVTQSLTRFPNTSFILSAGDQVESSSSESQYDGFFSPEELLSTPLVPTIGNHDNGTLYQYHYNSPNESDTYGTTSAGGDYWFTYGNTLYMVLNSNNQSATSHEAFIGQAIMANAGNDIKWRVVMFHHSIYSSASHSTDSDILSRRSDLYPIFDEYDIDVVLSGHDHCYTRSYQMQGGTAQLGQLVDAQGRVVNPTGTLYITANSASGSKYYDFKNVDTAYMANRWQEKVPSYSNIEITDNTFAITTYRVDTGAVIDTYTIYKDADSSGGTETNYSMLTATLNEEIGTNHRNPVYVLDKSEYTTESWSAYEAAIAAGIATEANGSATQLEIDNARLAIITAKAQLEPLNVGDITPYYVTLQPGSDETSMNFNWITPTAGSASKVQIAKASEMINKYTFPETAHVFTGAGMAVTSDIYSNKAVVTGLESSTQYAYRVGDGTHYSKVYTFTTQDPESYSAIFVGDPQIGASGNIVSDALAWQNTVSKALDAFGSASFILSAGDQVDTADSDDQYLGFFSPPELAEMPLAPTIGNHDDNVFYRFAYNLPNESSTYGLTNAGGDNWFTYGNTLYIVLNSNNQSATAHDAFINEAITAAGDNIKWKVVMFHHSIYSSASHSTDSDILSRRSDLYPIFDKYDIDVVLAGHDHCYTRSYQMLGGVAQKAQTVDDQGRVLNPTGTLYITADSASGSKYYDFKSADTDYMATRWQEKVPSYSNITVTNDTFTITTYRVDNGAVIDTYSISKGLALGAEQTGGAGYQRVITIGDTPADLSGMYVVVQLTDGSGASAKVSVVSISATDKEMRVSYMKAGTKIKVWLVSGFPNLTSGNMGVTVYAYTFV